jgi:hypothetical protein
MSKYFKETFFLLIDWLIDWFWYDWSLNSGLHAYKADTILFDPLLQPKESFFLGPD